MNARFLSIAEVEAAEAALYYEQRQYGLGDQFIAALERVLDRIRCDPRSLAKVENYTGPYELRRCILDRFPYIVIFQIQFDEAVIIAVSDARRRPFYWLERLR